jgi:hypothetical protein
MRILSQNNEGMKGYHGTLGTPTNMYDSFGNKLFVGDVVIVSNQDRYAKANKYLGDDYGIAFVCEENVSIARFTDENRQYVMGIANIWNDKAFEDYPIDYNTDYWDDLLSSKDGWIVHKVKDWSKVVNGERIGFLYVDEVG